MQLKYVRSSLDRIGAKEMKTKKLPWKEMWVEDEVVMEMKVEVKGKTNTCFLADNSALWECPWNMFILSRTFARRRHKSYTSDPLAEFKGHTYKVTTSKGRGGKKKGGERKEGVVKVIYAQGHQKPSRRDCSCLDLRLWSWYHCETYPLL